MKRFLNLPPWQSVGLIAAVAMAVYLVVAVTVDIRGGSQNSLSVFAVVLAYVILAAALVLYLAAWRRRPNAAERLVDAFLRRNKVVADWIGSPVDVSLAERIGRGGADGVQMPVTADLRGPLGTGTAHLTLARVSGTWEVLQAELDCDGARHPLSTGR
jgi:hypothetical protein